ncbi:MAG: beta-ketoacyl synthase N-terminal-like domain-containing protein, partial [Actinomycetota bacterium]|nr:beta-ketoacyl synthase N-terminal-like domain-containing protein [Actinomycetota bacterium]
MSVNMWTRDTVGSLVCGVNVTVRGETSRLFANSGMLSQDGRCKTLDITADGYVRGEGCYVLNLSRASSDSGSFIVGSAVNQDGRSTSLTAPNGPSQQAVIRSALGDARMSPSSVSAIEMHGTGTSLGDPIEVGAAVAVLSKDFAETQVRPTVFQSIKACLGHGETSAGLAGIFNALTSIEHRRTHALLHLRSLNVYVGDIFGALARGSENFVHVLPRDASGMPSKSASDLNASGISSFAFMGTNAHVLVSGHSRDLSLPRDGPLVFNRRRLLLTPTPATSISLIGAGPAEATFQVDIGSPRMHFLWDHIVNGKSIMPGAGYVEIMFGSASYLASDNEEACLAEGLFLSPIMLSSSTPVLECRASLDTGRVEVTSLNVFSGETLKHSESRLISLESAATTTTLA